jgi:hypothetical protein
MQGKRGGRQRVRQEATKQRDQGERASHKSVVDLLLDVLRYRWALARERGKGRDSNGHTKRETGH